MYGSSERIREAECGCRYDTVTGYITNFCDNLNHCEFKLEREDDELDTQPKICTNCNGQGCGICQYTGYR